MAFQTPITVAKVLDKIDRREYVLPALQREFVCVASPGAIPKHLRELRANIARLVLPSRRARSFPRIVKVKLSSYPVKRTRSAKK
jgi:hypothetical protein